MCVYIYIYIYIYVVSPRVALGEPQTARGQANLSREGARPAIRQKGGRKSCTAEGEITSMGQRLGVVCLDSMTRTLST